MNSTKPIKIKIFAYSVAVSTIKNPTAVINRVKTIKTVPNWRMVLLPNFLSKHVVVKAVITCSKFKNIGIKAEKFGNIYDAIKEP